MTSKLALARELMEKAGRACNSAAVLLELGDVDGATNRAYYAMFDAARAGLLILATDAESDLARSHSGLIGAFGSYLVKSGHVSKEHGRALNRAHEIRMIADYSGESVDASYAEQMLIQAREFVTEIRAKINLD